ncbi:hypothetical protein N658DRAFT_223866 [Parathielavia hyrcaniae]|uniref:Uncharacterized protein n=1 Tax=Parathielavia hyrcaniae TaxID=113614 RepID=A0AAN6SZ33_9PEZI|nr:hypothetical protein N658DRAFT_223866 [Parathielavia hyrcaniae]
MSAMFLFQLIAYKSSVSPESFDAQRTHDVVQCTNLVDQSHITNPRCAPTRDRMRHKSLAGFDQDIAETTQLDGMAPDAAGSEPSRALGPRTLGGVGAVISELAARFQRVGTVGLGRGCRRNRVLCSVGSLAWEKGGLARQVCRGRRDGSGYICAAWVARCDDWGLIVL